MDHVTEKKIIIVYRKKHGCMAQMTSCSIDSSLGYGIKLTFLNCVYLIIILDLKFSDFSGVFQDCCTGWLHTAISTEYLPLSNVIWFAIQSVCSLGSLPGCMVLVIDLLDDLPAFIQGACIHCYR